MQIEPAIRVIGALYEVFDHVDEWWALTFKIGRQKRQNGIIFNIAVKLREGLPETLLIIIQICYQMAAGGHAGSTAAGKGYLHRFGWTQYFVAFKELYGQERNLPGQFYILLIPVQKIAEVTVHSIVVILVTKDFECRLLKFFFWGYGKYVSRGKQWQ